VIFRNHPRLQPVVFRVVPTEALREELLPPISVLGVRGVGVFLGERTGVRRVLPVAGIDTS
jgi:hypothetical protein